MKKFSLKNLFTHHRVYTLKKSDPWGNPTASAHPARFSPDDKFSKHRVNIKRKYKVLMTDSAGREL